MTAGRSACPPNSEKREKNLAHLDEIKLDPMYLTPAEKQIIDEQLAQSQGLAAVDKPIADYVKQINAYPFIATVRSCSGHGYPGHVSFRLTREWHEKFIQTGIKPLILEKLCKIYLEVGDYLRTETGLYFRWNAKFTEENRDVFFGEFLSWLGRESDPEKSAKTST